MTAYLKKSFSVPLGLSAQGRDNWDRIFSHGKVIRCDGCGGEKLEAVYVTAYGETLKCLDCGLVARPKEG